MKTINKIILMLFLFLSFVWGQENVIPIKILANQTKQDSQIAIDSLMSLKISTLLHVDSLLLSNNSNVIANSQIEGLQWNSSTDTYVRLNAASGKSRSFFDGVYPWAGMRRCNLSDAGVVTAYYGNTGYIEDGSNGQCMVEIPLFYYKVNILPAGYQWLVSATPQTGFTIHPMFVRNGVTYQYIYIGAFLGSAYKTSASRYMINDSSGISFAPTSGDKLSSVAGVGIKPISGWHNSLTIASTRILAHNRGAGWEQQDFLTESGIQLLYLIEYASFNTQSQISIGVTNITDDGSTNMSIDNGYTGTRSGGTNLGNTSGQVVVTHYQTSQTTHSMSYRGIENWYGNLYQFVDGINIQDNVPYIADHGFVSDQFTSPYSSLNMTLCQTNGWATNIFVNNTYSYPFLPSTVGGSSSTYLTDYYYQASGNRIALLGGDWAYGADTGGFHWVCNDESSDVYWHFGGRLLFWNH